QYIDQPIVLQPYAKKLKAELDEPKYDQVSASGFLPISGTVEDYGKLASPYVWIHVEYEGQAKGELPGTMDYYVPIKDGHFKQTVRFFQGRGDYQVSVRLPDETKKNYYYLMASFTAYNGSDEISRDIVYSVTARQAGLSIANPSFGYVQADDEVWVSGSVGSGIQRVLIQLRKGNRVWHKEISTDHGRFGERVPLLFGQGVHEIQVMVPVQNKPETFIEGATLYAEHMKNVERSPIIFTSLYSKRGIHLTSPEVSGDIADLSYRIAGTIDPTGEDAKQTRYMIVRTQKGEDKATYFIPVYDYRFDGKIWLRFGSGTYKVTVYVPEITRKRRDYFRFFTVAEFEVTSTAKEDLRYLLPSRGIQSDDPTIEWLAQHITEGHQSDRSKAKAIYLYVAKTMNYDVEKFRENEFAWDDSALKSLKTHSGVCQDYVFLTIALLRASDIPSRFVEGVAGGQRHAWVEAKIGDRWVTMDPTWGSGYITPSGQFVKKLDMRYFDPDPAFFAKTHKRTGVVY
ncbi:MAG: transglutaminase-like domain-containing protein, partial [Thermoactinomyces sp.]